MTEISRLRRNDLLSILIYAYLLRINLCLFFFDQYTTSFYVKSTLINTVMTHQTSKSPILIEISTVTHRRRIGHVLIRGDRLMLEVTEARMTGKRGRGRKRIGC